MSAQDLLTMTAIDELYTKCPFYGSRRIRRGLCNSYGITVCREHIQRLMREMGLEAVYPRKYVGLSDPEPTNTRYPYLLRGLKVTHPNHVWDTDITYIRLEQGFCYLVALLGWYSRHIISWTLSSSLGIDFCLDNLQSGLQDSTPEIHNSDQGSHFTSRQYTDILKSRKVKISMDGIGRCMDNIFTERLWRTIKYENVYLRSYNSMAEAKVGLTEYLKFYNDGRPHQSLNYQTPAQVYFK